MALTVASLMGGTSSAAILYFDSDPVTAGIQSPTNGQQFLWAQKTVPKVWNPTNDLTGINQDYQTNSPHTPTFTQSANYTLGATGTLGITGMTLTSGNVIIANGQTTGTAALSLGQASTFDVAANKLLTVSIPLTGSFGIDTNNTGTLKLSGANTYTGTTTINAGTLVLGASNVLPATTVVLNGGTLDTGGGFTDAAGTLDVNSASVINMNLTDSLAFDASAGESWTGTLAIWNWDPLATSLRFGTTSSGLTASQVSGISIFGGAGSEYLGTGQLDSSGFLVVVPEPGAVVAVLGLLGAVGWRERRSFLRVRGSAA